MSTLELKAYEIFKSKLGEKEAETLIEFFDSKVEEKFKQKADISKLANECRVLVHESFHGLAVTKHTSFKKAPASRHH